MSVEKRRLRSGKTIYNVRWRDGGRNRARHFDRLRDANAWDAEVRRRKRLGELGLLDSGKQTVRELHADWIELYARPRLAASTIESYELIWRVHIEPRLGMRKLIEVTPEVVEIFVGDLRTAGVGGATIRKALVVLQGMFKRAVVWGRIARNPVAAASKPVAQRGRTVRPFSPAQVEKVRSTMGTRDATLVSVLAYSGLRPGEALALRWADIGERMIIVERAASLGQIKTTKTRRSRVVKLLAPLALDLREWHLAQGRLSDSALVFPGHDGAVWDRGDWKNWRRRIFAPAAAAVGLSSSRPYDLRHSFCSLLLAEGSSIVEIAGQLGHSPTMTLNVYGHVIADFHDAVRVSAEAAIWKARGGQPSMSYKVVAPLSAPG